VVEGLGIALEEGKTYNTEFDYRPCVGATYAVFTGAKDREGWIQSSTQNRSRAPLKGCIIGIALSRESRLSHADTGWSMSSHPRYTCIDKDGAACEVSDS
jgi:hypothetical protein